MSAQLRKMQRGARRSGTQISDLPSCIVREILSRVPLPTLSSSCRYVCNDWFQLADTSLALDVLQKLPTCLLQKEIPNIETLLFGWVVEDETEAIGDGDRFQLQMAHLTTRMGIPISKLRCVNTCNGLLCLQESGYEPEVVFVCNPVLGEWISIPCYLTHEYAPVDVVLGFSPSINQYKLLRTSFLDIMESEGEIYTIGTGKWRNIGRIPQFRENFNTFLNGCLHWAEDNSQPICCFSFDTEVATSIPLPSAGFPAEVELGVLNGCLCASFWKSEHAADPNADPEVWVMKEYGVEASWTLLVVVVEEIPAQIAPWKAEKVLVAENRGPRHHDLMFSLDAEEDEILVSDSGSFVSYNVRRKTVWMLDAIGPDPIADENLAWVAYNPSLISLRDVAKGEDVTVASVKTKLKVF